MISFSYYYFGQYNIIYLIYALEKKKNPEKKINNFITSKLVITWESVNSVPEMIKYYQ